MTYPDSSRENMTLLVKHFAQLPKEWRDFFRKDHPHLVAAIERKYAQLPFETNEFLELREELTNINKELREKNERIRQLEFELETTVAQLAEYQTPSPLTKKLRSTVHTIFGPIPEKEITNV